MISGIGQRPETKGQPAARKFAAATRLPFGTVGVLSFVVMGLVGRGRVVGTTPPAMSMHFSHNLIAPFPPFPHCTHPVLRPITSLAEALGHSAQTSSFPSVLPSSHHASPSHPPSSPPFSPCSRCPTMWNPKQWPEMRFFSSLLFRRRLLRCGCRPLRSWVSECL